MTLEAESLLAKGVHELNLTSLPARCFRIPAINGQSCILERRISGALNLPDLDDLSVEDVSGGQSYLMKVLQTFRNGKTGKH